MTRAQRAAVAAPGTVEIGGISAGRDVLLATRDIVISVLPGGRKTLWGLILALVTLVLLAGVTLEGWTCQRFGLCLPGVETITRQEQVTQSVARVELGVARMDPELLATNAGLIVANRGTAAILISTGPVAQETRVLPRAATKEDIATAAQRLAELPGKTLAGIVLREQALFSAHPPLAQALFAQVGPPVSPEDCAGLQTEVWRRAIRSTLVGSKDGAEGTGLTLSLMATALDCDPTTLDGINLGVQP